jgi:hypothetical protein
MMKMNRAWAMPNSNTFDIPPIKDFIYSYLPKTGCIIDPFANKNRVANITNDLNPEYDTDYHMDALDFLKLFEEDSVDCVLYDPPYSPRQVSECYKNFGMNVTSETTRCSFWSAHKKEISRILRLNGIVLSFGWNSNGIGKSYGFEIEGILLVAHGSHHNDTICVAERRI